MSSPDIKTIELLVEFSPEGVPMGIRYHDGEGCGHEGDPVSLRSPISDLVNYHLQHCARSHRIFPIAMCHHNVQVAGMGSTYLTCTLQKHDSSTKHRFEL